MMHFIVEHEHEMIVVGYVGGGRATSLDSAHMGGRSSPANFTNSGIETLETLEIRATSPPQHKPDIYNLTQRWSSTTRAALLLLSPFCGSLQPPALKR